MLRPFLIENLKFDIRMYVLLTGVDPLRLWIHEDAFLRFATENYVLPKNGNIKDLTVHLTNYAINKNAVNFKKN